MIKIDLIFFLVLLCVGTVFINSTKRNYLRGYRKFTFLTIALGIFIIIYQFGVENESVTSASYLFILMLAVGIKSIILLLDARVNNKDTKYIEVLGLIELLLIISVTFAYYTSIVDLDIYVQNGVYYSTNARVENMFVIMTYYNSVLIGLVYYRNRNKKYGNIIGAAALVFALLYLFIPQFTGVEIMTVTYLLIYLLFFVYNNDQGISYEDNSKILEYLDLVYIVLDNHGKVVKIGGSNKEIHRNLMHILNEDYETAFARFLKRNSVEKIRENLYFTGTRYVERYEKQLTKQQKIIYFMDVTDEHITTEDIEQLSYIDPVTKLKNRKALKNSYHEINLSRKCIVFIDMNKLKYINDTYGHMHGDRALAHFSRCLVDFFGDKHLYRVGGDEFVVIIPKKTYYASNLKILPFYIDNKEIELTCSMGLIKCSRYHDKSFLELVKCADAAMYYAKKNNIMFANYSKVKNLIKEENE